jgi:hypothetical protein
MSNTLTEKELKMATLLFKLMVLFFKETDMQSERGTLIAKRVARAFEENEQLFLVWPEKKESPIV